MFQDEKGAGSTRKIVCVSATHGVSLFRASLLQPRLTAVCGGPGDLELLEPHLPRREERLNGWNRGGPTASRSADNTRRAVEAPAERVACLEIDGRAMRRGFIKRRKRTGVFRAVNRSRD